MAIHRHTLYATSGVSAAQYVRFVAPPHRSTNWSRCNVDVGSTEANLKRASSSVLVNRVEFGSDLVNQTKRSQPCVLVVLCRCGHQSLWFLLRTVPCLRVVLHASGVHEVHAAGGIWRAARRATPARRRFSRRAQRRDQGLRTKLTNHRDLPVILTVEFE